LTTIFKYEGDVRKAQTELREFAARQKARARSEGSRTRPTRMSCTGESRAPVARPVRAATR
jgi:hypothetical protein